MGASLTQKYDERYAIAGPVTACVGSMRHAWPRNRIQALCYPVGEGDVLLEVGCGEGVVLAAMASRYRKLLGTEMSAVRLERACALLKGKDFTGYLVANEGLTPICADSVDRVLSADVIEHVVNPYRHVREVFRVLKPGGDYIVNTPNIAFLPRRAQLLLGVFPSTSARREGLSDPVLFDGGHLHYFTVSSLSGLLKQAGFEVLASMGFGRWGRIHDWWPSVLSSGVQIQARKPSFDAAANRAITQEHRTPADPR